jgi:fructose-bisphosphate aldolase class II
LFTTKEDVEAFISASIDILAPSIGNLHGDYPPSGPSLHYDRLESINKQIKNRVHVALHGTNDFPEQTLQRCIRAGAIKLNVNKLLLEPWNVFVKENAGKMPLVRLIDEGMDVLQKETERWMDVCESSGKA